MNVLFIVIDQLRADVLSGRLQNAVATPHLDTLAAASVVFKGHHTVTAPCGPSRASLLTGLYAHRHGSLRNGTPLAAHHTNLALEARKLGYEPLLFGYTDTSQDPATHHAKDPDLRSYETVLRGFREITEMRLETGYEWPAYLISRGYDVPLPLPERHMDLFAPVDGLGSPARYRAEDSDTAYLTDEVIKALSVRNPGWFAHVTYIRPHPPLVAPAPYHAMIDPAEVPPVLPSAPHPFFDAWFSAPAQFGLFTGFDGRCDRLSEDQVALLRATYLGLVAEVDHHIGRLLAWLDENGQAEQTMVVLTADHGELLGDRGLWGKDSVFNQAFHIPLMIHVPGGQPGQVTGLTESVDVMPTILDVLGGMPPSHIDGRSLMPVVRGETPARPVIGMELTLGEPAAPTRFETSFGENPDLGARIIRDGQHKVVLFHGCDCPDMVFDLTNDPDELNDLMDTPEGPSLRDRLRRAWPSPAI